MLTEKVEFKGVLKILTTSSDQEDDWKVVFEDRNLIVNLARKTLARALSGEGLVGIKYLRLGTGGHTPGQVFVAKVPGYDDYKTARTQLFSETSSYDQTDPLPKFVMEKDLRSAATWYRVNPVGATEGAIESITFIAALTKAEGNYTDNPSLAGFGYTEAALCAENDTKDMFCMRCFPLVPKDPNRRIGLS